MDHCASARQPLPLHHATKPGTVAGKPSADVPPGTLNSALKQAGLKKQLLCATWSLQKKALPVTVLLSRICPAASRLVGETEAEALALIEDAIRFHLEDIKAGGLQIPPPALKSTFVEVAMA